MKLLFLLVCVFCLPMSARTGEPAPPRSPDEFVFRQEPPLVVPRVLDRATPENTRLKVSLARQRAYLLVGEEVAIDAAVSTGVARAQTPPGQFKVAEKAATRNDSMNGDFVDGEGRVVRAGVSTRIDAAPSGTTFRMVPLRYFLGLDAEGVSLHAGRLPGFPSTDRSIRLPADIAPLVFQRVKEGTPVEIGD